MRDKHDPLKSVLDSLPPKETISEGTCEGLSIDEKAVMVWVEGSGDESELKEFEKMVKVEGYTYYWKDNKIFALMPLILDNGKMYILSVTDA